MVLQLRSHGSRRARARAVAALLSGLVLAVPASAPAAGPAVEFSEGISAGAVPFGIAAGPDGNLWFTEVTGDRIGRITPTGTVDQEFKDITIGAGAFMLAAGPDGNLWFTEYDGNRIGRITPTGTVDHEFSSGISPGAHPYGIAAGPDGNLWFAEAGIDRIGLMTPTGTVVNQFSIGITAGAHPHGIAAGPDGNLWFTEHDGDRIGRITPTGTVDHEFSSGISPGAHPSGIAAGPDGNLWFTEYDGDRIGRITPTGTIDEFFKGITAGAHPYGIAAGPDGNLWFTEYDGGRIGRITPAGTIDEFSRGITAGAGLAVIAAGPDGNLWFTERDGKRIGRIATDVPAPVTGNLLRNPGFELGAPGSSRAVTVPVPGWVTVPNFTEGLYGGGDLPPATLGDQIGGGHSFAWGGAHGDVQSQALQVVDVAREGAAIDDGRATVTLFGLLGGQGGQEDNARVSALFVSATGGLLASLQIGPVTPADRGNQTTLLARSASAVVPAGTRAIRVVATATNIGAGSNNGYFDNLSLGLDVTPLPAGGGGGFPGGGGALGAASLGGASLDTIAPEFLAARMTNTTFAVDQRGAAETAVAARVRRGTTFAYTLSEASTVLVTIERRQKGRRVGRTCRKASRRNRARKACTRYVSAGRFDQAGAAGANMKKFSGRIGKRSLRPGAYRATLGARDGAGNRSGAKRLAFKIVRG